MTIMTPCVQRAIWCGVDTHRDEHVAAIVDGIGSVLGTRSFAATSRGYFELRMWLLEHGKVVLVGIEGTGAYGAGLQRDLHEHGIDTREIDRPDRKRRRDQGKSDPLDAVSAAKAALAAERIVEPKRRDGKVEALRNLRIARRSAIDQRAVAQRQMRTIIVTAPDELRQCLRELSSVQLVARCAASRPRPARVGEPIVAAQIALRALARRHQALSLEIDELDELIDQLVRATKPELLEQFGVGIEVASQLLVSAGENPERLRNEAAFAMLCGVAPIPASSGQRCRHRLNRGGDRHANRAIHTIVLVRKRHDERTQRYIERRTRDGLSQREITRCLKRYVARDIYRLLVD